MTAVALATVVATAAPAAAVASTTSVTASPTVTAVGGPVRLTATVTCTSDPSGGLGVSFFDGGDLLTTVPVSATGRARHTVYFTTPGTHTITAAYNGNGACDASSSTTTVAVSTSPVPPPSGHCSRPCGGLLGWVVGGLHHIAGRDCVWPRAGRA